MRFRDPTAVREAIVDSIQQTLERGRIAWQEKFRKPLIAPAAASEKTGRDLKLRPEVTAPQEAHRELPHLGPSVAAVVHSGRPSAPQAVGQAVHLPSEQIDSASDARVLQQQAAKPLSSNSRSSVC